MVTASRWPASTARSVSATAGTRRDPFSDLRRTNGMRFLAGCETENSTVSGGIDRASGRAMDACGLWPADRGGGGGAWRTRQAPPLLGYWPVPSPFRHAFRWCYTGPALG